MSPEIGKVGFFFKPMDAINKLTSRITGLSNKFAEPLQIVSYGTGGHYEPHIDYFRMNNVTSAAINSDSGDRLATLILYLNDVAEGGATVFPRLGLAVHPRQVQQKT